MREITIEESHRLLLALAKEFHSVCERNEIPYFMLGGTMLGAVRHKGFIPWDDDMDFGIPREYFSFFIDSCKKDLPSSYKVLYYDNSDYAILGFVKLSDSRTVVEEVFAPITDEVLGVNIDVFPLDLTDIGMMSFGKKWSKFRRKLLFYRAKISKVTTSISPFRTGFT